MFLICLSLRCLSKKNERFASYAYQGQYKEFTFLKYIRPKTSKQVSSSLKYCKNYKEPSGGVPSNSVHKICNKSTKKHPSRSAISIQLLYNFFEITLRHGCFPVTLLHICRTPFYKNTCACLFLKNLEQYKTR